MAHAPEDVNQYVCENCQVIHAGTPVHRGPGEHSFDPPEACGACSESRFIEIQNWTTHHE